MASPVKTYQHEMQKFGYRATWEPNAPVRLGAVGKLHAGGFIPYTSLEKLGITMETDQSDGQGDLEHNTEGGVDFSTKLSGQISDVAQHLGDADAGLIIEFKKEKAVAFKANNTTNHQIVNLADVRAAVLQLFLEGKWDRRYVVVTNLITAETTSVFISRSSGGKVELKAEGKLSPGKVDIADAEAKFSLAGRKKMETTITGAGGLGPLYRVMGVKTGFLGIGEPDFDVKTMSAEAKKKLSVETIEADDDEYAID